MNDPIDLNSLNALLVGGAVRDKLLGIDNYDRDWVVVGQSPEEMTQRGFIAVGKDFPVFINPQTGEEYALARTERKHTKGYHGFNFNCSPNITLEQDLSRRDLTINAMAEREDGTIIDPYNGQQDLANGILRHVSDAFIEDPVRILRIARFAAKFGFKIAQETQTLMKEMVQNGEVDSLVAERVWQEMHKALQTTSPQLFFKVLRDCGALAKIIPEIDALFGIPQTAKYHPEIDTGIHTLMVVEQAAKISSNTHVRFAALVHDLGKATTPKETLPSHRGHEKRGVKLVKQLCKRLRVPKKYHALALAVTEYHLHMHKMFELRAETVLNMLEKTGCLKHQQRAEHIAQACLADARGRTGFENTPYSQITLFLNYAQAANQVDTKAIAQQHNDGETIKASIRCARLDAISGIKTSSI